MFSDIDSQEDQPLTCRRSQHALWILAAAQIIVTIVWMGVSESWDVHVGAILLLGMATLAIALYAVFTPERGFRESGWARAFENESRKLKKDDSLLLESRDSFPAIPRIQSSAALTRSGLHDSVPGCDLSTDFLGPQSQEFSTVSDMIDRLDPYTLRWLDSSAAGQAFLGWSLDELRMMSFLDIVHPNHRELAREQLLASIAKGESHGLIYRIRTASGDAKAVEINVGVRYAPDGSPGHLRCHVTDVTDRLRASRELRKRTRELLTANEELLRTNRELRELKDLYSDLYQNAPTMHFSLDAQGVIRECNKTLLETLGYGREDLIGRSYASILPEWWRAAFAVTFSRFLRTGKIEVETRWIKADGELLDVWVKATAIRAEDGSILRTRSVAQDITARKSLEAQLREKNVGLAQANEELSRKNHELDVFSHVVSHDLQEPLRSLNYFSDLLKTECGESLGESGQQHLCYVVDASKRMRAMVRDLLNLSRAGRTTGDFGPVDIAAIIEQIRADFSVAIATKNAELRSFPPFPPTWGDRDRVAQLLANLISNALKYNLCEAKTRVEVSAREEADGSVVIAVRDNGIGIDPKHHQQVFQIFRRLHAGDEFEGTGAGLAICQKIVQAHGGKIWVESKAGEGATFFVRLPGRPDLAHSREICHSEESSRELVAALAEPSIIPS